MCSDRWSAYGRLSPYCRQVCWAHLKRDFQKLVDRGGPSAPLGQALLQVTEQVFQEWHLFRGGGCDRPALQQRLEGTARQLERLLRKGRRCADGKTATFCENVLALLPAVWRFVVSDGVEPTNNHAERLLRARGAVAEECLRQRERGRLPFRGASADRGADTAASNRCARLTNGDQSTGFSVCR